MKFNNLHENFHEKKQIRFFHSSNLHLMLIHIQCSATLQIYTEVNSISFDRTLLSILWNISNSQFILTPVIGRQRIPTAPEESASPKLWLALAIWQHLLLLSSYLLDTSTVLEKGNRTWQLQWLTSFWLVAAKKMKAVIRTFWKCILYRLPWSRGLLPRGSSWFS